MSDWIDDLFDNLEQEEEISERMRDRLLLLLERCRFEYIVHENYEAEILSSDLNRARYQKLSTTLESNVLDIRYEYAPSQRHIAKWLRQFCEL